MGLRLGALAAGAIALGAVAARAPEGRPATPVVAVAAVVASPGPALVTADGIAAARRWARTRKGVVAFATLDGRGRLRGLNRSVPFPSASVVKAMLMVATLREAGSGPIDARTAKRLTAMVTASDNDAADAIYARVGGAGLRAVARAAHATRFRDVGSWAGTRVTAADQARLFYRIDTLVPARHRELARTLLSSVVPAQRWGIPPIAARRGMRVFFKGGWRKGITHQVALLERGGRRVALAVFTSGDTRQAYARRTIKGIAVRVLR